MNEFVADASPWRPRHAIAPLPRNPPLPVLTLAPPPLPLSVLQNIRLIPLISKPGLLSLKYLDVGLSLLAPRVVICYSVAPARCQILGQVVMVYPDMAVSAGTRVKRRSVGGRSFIGVWGMPEAR